MTTAASPLEAEARAAVAANDARVSPLELFFDLVFVFAITQVTAFIAADPTWPQVIRGLLILAMVWWAWAAYAWLTDSSATSPSACATCAP